MTADFKFVVPVAAAGSVVGLLGWMYLTNSDLSRLFEFGIWTGFGTMVPGLLVAAGASDNTFEDGERYDAMQDASQKQERVQGATPILLTCVLAGALILAISVVASFFIASNV